MRFMMLMYPGITDEEWQAPDPEEFGKMSAFNEELAQAGALLALDGLHPGGTATQVTVKNGEKSVVDGPFAEAKEVLGGYWVIQADTREEAVEWASRVPLGARDRVELRQIQELSDFPEEVQDQARLSQTPPNQPVESND